jgi:hypothetical protein
VGYGFSDKGSQSGRSGKDGPPVFAPSTESGVLWRKAGFFCDICAMSVRLFLWILWGSFMAGTQMLYAQGKPVEPAKHALAPVFRSSLGNVLSNKVPASLMRQLLDSTLIARDSQGVKHRVVSFEFGYRTTTSYRSDTTGAVEHAHSYLSFHFNSNRLDSLWRSRIGPQIKPGDELYFDRIIADGGQGVKFLSSSLHFQVN